MKINAIIYTSNTGYTKQYAALLGEKTGLAVYSLKDAKTAGLFGSSVIYLGWIMAGKIKGYTQASKQFNVVAACGVGMGATGSQIEDIRKANILPTNLPVFTLQGGFDLKKLHGIYKLMMIFMSKVLGKKLSESKERTPEEDAMYDLLINGGCCVNEKNLDAVLRWYNIHRKSCDASLLVPPSRALHEL